MPANSPGNRLALDGGSPAVSEFPCAWPPSDEAIRNILLESFANGDWGRYEAQYGHRLRQALCESHSVGHAWLCCSGTMAVELALRGLGVRASDEVVLAGYDFPGNFRAIESIGATPVLVDIEPATWCLDAEQVEAAIGPGAKAIIVSHLHGGLADMRRIVEIANKHGLGVVEDACQAPGAMVQGRAAGCWGDVGVLSFGGSKLLSAGRGGALLTNNATVLQRVKIYSQRGNDAFPLSEMQAAVLLPQIEVLGKRNALRHQNVQYLLEICRDCTHLDAVTVDLRGVSSFYKLAFRYHQQRAGGVGREPFVAALQAEGVACGEGFRGFARRGSRRCRIAGSLEQSKIAAQHTVLLHHPIFLQPPNVIDSLAKAIEKVAQVFRQRQADGL